MSSTEYIALVRDNTEMSLTRDTRLTAGNAGLRATFQPSVDAAAGRRNTP
jgi:hypothetical protein